MRRTAVLSIVLFCSVMLLLTGMNALGVDDIAEHRSCTLCGMDRKAYGYSRMLVQYADGRAVGLCSLNCAAIELEANKDRPVKTVLVADRDTRELLPADQAVWVAGGSKRGVMTEHPTWAFKARSSADAFIRSYGGSISSWNDVLAAAKEETGKDRRFSHQHSPRN